MQGTTLKSNSKILYLIFGICLLLVLAIGTGWYLTFDTLRQVRIELDTQEQETQKYLQLSDQYESELDNTINQLSVTKDKLENTETKLDDMQSRYETVSLELSQTQNQLQQTNHDLEEITSELTLYKETWGSIVASGEKPPFSNVNVVNNPQSENPSWPQLQSFVLADKTDANPYLPDSYVCGEFASDVHNHAEASGIRCALVAIELKDVWHACDAFLTTDRGLVFIDCTGVVSGDGPANCDKLVTVKLGGEYIPISMFPEPGWLSVWENMGIILDVQIYW